MLPILMKERKMKSIFGLLVLLAALPFTGLVEIAVAQTHDLAADFSANQNPNGVWSYGWSKTRGSTFQLAAIKDQDTSYGNIKAWRIAPESEPAVAFAATDINHPTVRVPAGAVWFHPGPQCQNAVIRWTSPASDYYMIQGWFIGRDFVYPTTTDVAILQGKIEMFSGNINNYEVPLKFAFSTFINAGETMDFTVGCGSNETYTGDSTGIQITIQKVRG
jgi:hypothetical protein